MTDPVLVQRIITLYENGQEAQALELLERIANGGSIGLLDPCNVGGWTLERDNGAKVFVDAELDLEGNLVISGEENGVATVWKYETSTGNALGPNGPVDGAMWKRSIPGFEMARNLDTDSDGFIYVGMYTSAQDFTGLAKLTPEGGLIWVTDLIPLSPVGHVNLDVQVGPDGVPVFHSAGTITQINPFTGFIEWNYVYPGNGQVVDSIGVDAVGDVYFARLSGGLRLQKISGASGLEMYPTLPLITSDFVGNQTEILFDAANNVVVVGGTFSPETAVAAKYSPNGDPIWSQSWQGQGAPLDQRHMDAAIDRDGNVILLGSNVANEPMVTKLSSDGQYQWQHTYTPTPALTAGGTWDGRGDVTTDRAGNIYFSVNYTGNHWIVRIDPALPAAPECQWSDFSTQINPIDLVVDGGGSIFTTRLDFGAPSKVAIRKIEQTVDLPLEFTASPMIALKDQSVWPGSLGQISSETTLFDPTWDLSLPIGGFIDSWFFDDTGAALTLATAGQIQAGFKSEISGGTFTMNFPIDVLWGTQGSDVAFGLPVDFDVSWDVDAAASFSTKGEPDFDAGITAGLNVDLFAGVRVLVDGDALLDETLIDLMIDLPTGYILNLGMFSSFIEAANIKKGEYVTIPTKAPGENFGVDLGIPGLKHLNIRMRNPKLTAQGVFVDLANKVNPATNSSTFRSKTADEIAQIDFSVTNILIEKFVESQPNLCPPLWQIEGTAANAICDLNKEIYSLDQSHSIDLGVISIGAKLELLQMKLQAEFEVNQQLDVEVTPKVRYVVKNGLGNPIPFLIPDALGNLVPGDPLVGVTLDSTLSEGAFDLRIRMPADGCIDIVPFVYGEVAVTNKTGSAVIPGIRWVLLKMGLSVRAFDRINLDLPELPEIATTTELGRIEVPLYEGSPFIVNTQEIELAPIRVAGLAQGEEYPRLIAASRTSLPMIIYDQTSPRVTSFNNAANGVSKMLLYGDRFELVGEGGILPVVKMVHHGRVEVLESTRLDANTILVEVPNRFRLLPGVARLWVERDHFDPSLGAFVTQTTGSLDMPIELPVPRLDAVNPNLWAADPDMYSLPMQVIDRKTLLGTDTFITRRDYYVKMRDDLWNSSTVLGLADAGSIPDINGNGLVDANEYFACFDFEALPPFPTVFFGTEDSSNPSGPLVMSPLSRFIQPIDSGIHNVWLAERNYNKTGKFPVQICNPGPGGGVSEILELHISAPIPVVDQLLPSEIEPGGELEPGQYNLELIVRGPRHVPTWDGFEEPKFGNFNGSSVVYFDGELVPSRFIDSSELRAFVPDYLVQNAGNFMLEVYTPSNGSRYLERKWIDTNGDGVPDTIEDPDGDGPLQPTLEEIPSGGMSPPIFFQVRFRQPLIRELSPQTMPAGNPAVGITIPGMKFPEFNFRVTGENFRDGAQVLVDGVPRVTKFLDRERLSVRLLPEDVALPGRRFISVLNPGRDGHVSEMVDFMVTTPKAAVYMQMGP